MSDMDDFIDRHEKAKRLGEELGTRGKGKKKDTPATDEDMELMPPGVAILPTYTSGPETPLMLLVAQEIKHALFTIASTECADHQTQAECLGSVTLWLLLQHGFILVHQPANAKEIVAHLDAKRAERRAKEAAEPAPKGRKTPPPAKDRLN